MRACTTLKGCVKIFAGRWSAKMGLMERFLPKEDRFAALMLYGMVFSTCFNGRSPVLSLPPIREQS